MLGQKGQAVDVFTLLIAIIIIMLAFQYGQNWIAFGTVLLLMLTMRSLAASAVLIAALVLIFITRGDVEAYWPLVIIGLIVFALILGFQKPPEQPEMYGGSDLGGLMQGL